MTSTPSQLGKLELGLTRRHQQSGECIFLHISPAPVQSVLTQLKAPMRLWISTSMNPTGLRMSSS